MAIRPYSKQLTFESEYIIAADEPFPNYHILG